MVGHGGSSAGLYLADPTSPMPSHCASIVATSSARVNVWSNNQICQFKAQHAPFEVKLAIVHTYLPKLDGPNQQSLSLCPNDTQVANGKESQHQFVLIVLPKQTSSSKLFRFKKNTFDITRFPTP